MSKTVVGLFDSHEHAHLAVQELLAAGFDRNHIGLLATGKGGTVRREVVEESGDLASAGAVSGMASGLLVGGLVGLLVGVTTLAAPPIGFVVAGPLAATLTGAGLGMVGGGLLGALMGLGIPAEEAHIYAESVRRGSILVSVQTEELGVLRAEQILASAGAVNIAERTSHLRSSGFTEYDPTAPAYSHDEFADDRTRVGFTPVAGSQSLVQEEVVFTPSEVLAPGIQNYHADFVTHYRSSVASTGLSFSHYEPAYRFGYELAHDATFIDLDWPAIVADTQRLWSRTNPNSDWSEFAPLIQYGWSRGRTHLATSRAGLI